MNTLDGSIQRLDAFEVCFLRNPSSVSQNLTTTMGEFWVMAKTTYGEY